MAAWASVVVAAQERYDYDPIGRLIRFTDSKQVVTEYRYDPAGNITAVIVGSASSQLPPFLASVTPSVVRQGQTASLTLTGQRLDVGTLSVSDPGLDLSELRQGATQLQAALAVAPTTPTGTQSLSFRSSRGTASIAILVAPLLPTLNVEPAPLALPPDGVTRSITLRLSGADLVPHQLVVALSDPAKASLSATALTIPAGQTTAQLGITPKASGFTNLTISSPTLRAVSVPVFITSDFRGVNTSQALPVGLQVGEAVPAAPGTTSATFKVNSLGLLVGSVLTDFAPRGFAVGGAYTLGINGQGIPAGAQLAVVPPDGVQLSAVSASATRIDAMLSIDASAAPGIRRLVVKDRQGSALHFADPQAATLQLTTGAPSLVSLDPLFAVPNSVTPLRLRGANLQGARVQLLPATDMAVDAAPVVSADGTELTVRVFTAALAAPGPRTVQVVTPSGSTPIEPSPANQFTVVQSIGREVSPIFAASIGVQVGATGTGGDSLAVGPVRAAQLGLSVGLAAQDIAPKVAVTGASTTVVVRGAGLQAVTQASVQSGDGLTVSAFSVNADGTQLSLPVAADLAATRGVRRVVLITPAGRLSFAQPDGDQLLVALPPPELVWVKPQVVTPGQTVTLSVLGRDLNDITGIRFEPPEGLLPAPPYAPTAGGTALSFSLQVAADAASGLRTLIVETAGGASASTPVPANTFQVARQVGPTLDAISAPPVGIHYGATPVTPEARDVYAASLGVVLSVDAASQTDTRSSHASAVGVLVGPGVRSVSPRSPDGLLKGATGTLVISGYGLAPGAVAKLTGPDALQAGPVQVNADGTQATVAVEVPATAASTYHGLIVSVPSGTGTLALPLLADADVQFRLGALPSLIDSVAPIVLEQGKTYTLVLRGSGLSDIYQVLAEPAAGLVFDDAGLATQWSTDAFGERLAITVRVPADAPVGSRVIRFRVPGGITAREAVPANTVTVVAPQ